VPHRTAGRTLPFNPAEKRSPHGTALDRKAEAEEHPSMPDDSRRTSCDGECPHGTREGVGRWILRREDALKLYRVIAGGRVGFPEIGPRDYTRNLVFCLEEPILPCCSSLTARLTPHPRKGGGLSLMLPPVGAGIFTLLWQTNPALRPPPTKCDAAQALETVHLLVYEECLSLPSGRSIPE